jgi:VWFA-related protein
MNWGNTLRDRAVGFCSFRASCLPARQSPRKNKAVALLVLWAFAAAGLSSAQAMAGQAAGEKEIAVQEVQSQFKLQVQRNMVLVRVVVRDANGNPVPNLRKEDFRLFDNGKPQEIEQFAVESARGARTVAPAPPPNEAEEKVPPAAEAGKEIARNYQALYFDDVQMTVEDVGRARDAADRYLARTLTPVDRVGIFTTSGQGNLDFTDDREKLHEALSRLQPKARISTGMTECPEIGEYQAYLIARLQDQNATEIAAEEYIACACGEGDMREVCGPQAQSYVQSEATQLWNQRETQSEGFLRGLEELVRRVSILPGQRSVILLSPGFLSYDLEWQIAQVTDRALRSGVIVNALDPRGIYTITPGGDAAHTANYIPNRPNLMAEKDTLIHVGLSVDEQVLNGFAEDTGGQFFHNSNDLDQGFRQLGTLSEVYYVLAFSPRNLRFDGRFHKLKVSLVNPAGFTLQARRGYFAPKASEDAATRAKEEIQQAAYSQDDFKELPIDVHTQYYKLNEAEARLAVLTHLDMNSVRFRQEKDLHVNSLTFLTVVFDRDGKCVVAKNKQVDLKLRDATIARLAQTGITVKTEVDLKPGTYSLRQIVRDSEAGQLSALSRTVEIPY